MEKLFAAIDAEEARAPRRQRSFDLGGRISEFLSSFTPRTLAWSATAAAVAILVQAAVITSVVVKEQGVRRARARQRAERRLLCGRALCPAGDRERHHQLPGRLQGHRGRGPLNMGGQLYRIRLSETKLPKDEVGKIIQQMQESRRSWASSP